MIHTKLQLQVFLPPAAAMLLLTIATCGPSAYAQGPGEEAGRGEVTAFGGIYRGEGLNAGSVGGGAGYTFHRNVRLFGETFYFRKDLSATVGAPSGISVNGSAVVFNGGVQVLLPIGDSPVVPFATAGYALARASASARAEGAAQSFNVSVSDYATSYMLGGGVDYYISNRWGLRPEFRVFQGPEYRMTVGIFYRF